MVLTWSGSAWAPANPPGGGGAPSSGDIWIAKLDGTLIGKVISWSNGSGFEMWDDQDSVLISYRSIPDSNPRYSTSTGGGTLNLYYTTADCSDSPHGFMKMNLQSIPNSAIAVGGILYKFDTVYDTINVLSSRWEDGTGALLPCSPASSQGKFPRLIPIAQPGVPLELPVGTFKFVKQ